MKKAVVFLVFLVANLGSAAAPTSSELACMGRAASDFRADYVRDIREGCVARAQSFHGYLVRRCPGVNGKMFQVWVGGVLSPASGVTWRYHTALAFDDSSGRRMVLDPSFSGDYMALSYWHDRCNPSGQFSTDQTNIGVISGLGGSTGTRFTTTAPAPVTVTRAPAPPTTVRVVATAPAPVTTVRVITSAPTYVVVPTYVRVNRLVRVR